MKDVVCLRVSCNTHARGHEGEDALTIFCPQDAVKRNQQEGKKEKKGTVELREQRLSRMVFPNGGAWEKRGGVSGGSTAPSGCPFRDVHSEKEGWEGRGSRPIRPRRESRGC